MYLTQTTNIALELHKYWIIFDFANSCQGLLVPSANYKVINVFHPAFYSENGTQGNDKFTLKMKFLAAVESGARNFSVLISIATKE